MTVFIALLIVFGHNPAEDSMQEQIAQEVTELHQFFQDWFNDELAENDTAFSRFAQVMAPQFEIVGPDGNTTAREKLLPLLRGLHASRVEQSFRIEVKNIRSRSLGSGLYLVSYEEWQYTGDKTRNWQSSVIMRSSEGKPNGLVWEHVHETYK